MSARTKIRRTHRIEVDHAPGCRSVQAVERGEWDTPWGALAEDGFGPCRFLNFRGHRTEQGRNVYWLRFACNDTECPARLLVNSNAIYAMVERGKP